MKKFCYSTILAGVVLFLVVSGSAFAHDDRYDDSYDGYGRHHHRHGYHQRHHRHYDDDDDAPPAYYRRDYRRPRGEAQVVVPVPVLPLPPLPHHLLFRHWFGR